MDENVIGTRIRAYRVMLRMSQASLAEKSGVATPTVHRIEAGKSKPHRATVAALADALGCPEDFLTSKN